MLVHAVPVGDLVSLGPAPEVLQRNIGEHNGLLQEGTVTPVRRHHSHFLRDESDLR